MQCAACARQSLLRIPRRRLAPRGKTGHDGRAQESASVSLHYQVPTTCWMNVGGLMKRRSIVAAAPPKRGWKAELATIVATHNWRHAAKPKGVGHKTAKERKRYLYALFTRMWRDPTRPLKVMPSAIREKHLRFEIERWQREELRPATMQTYRSFLNTFCGWIGKPGLLRPLESYFDDPHRYKRYYPAARDLSWEGNQIDAERAVAEIAQYDRHVGASLHMQLAFGLRCKESIMLRPHVDVVTAARTRITNASADDYLDTHRGTKVAAAATCPSIPT